MFFYQSPFGGRVFFDDLGPPWPKHPCTSTEIEKRGWPGGTGRTAVNSNRAQPIWQRDGWIPLEIKSISFEEPWWVIKATRLDSGDYIRFLSAAKPDLNSESVAFFRGWDGDGVSVVSFLYSGTTIAASECEVRSYARYFMVSPTGLSADEPG